MAISVYYDMFIYLSGIYLSGDDMVKMVSITLQGYRCERCKHEWLPKGKEAPMVCPKCKSPYWSRPRKKGKT